ncbi:MAG: response regulator, partial [Burkholderiaceae bacterium]
MKHFLLVDDEINVLNALQRTLRQKIGASELTIEVLTDPVQALERVGEKAFDLVISDYRMPIMNGIEFLIAVKK